MASTSSTRLSISSSSSLVDARAPRQPASASTQHIALRKLPPSPPFVTYQNRPWKATVHCERIARNVMAMATGDAASPTEVELETTELPLPEIGKTVQEAWDKVEDKYAVSSLAVTGVIGLWVSLSMISAIDRLPLVPSVLELVGIGYTGWFAYKNLIFKPEREELIQKIKDAYNDIMGSS